MKRMTLTKLLLIFLLGYAAVSVYWIFWTKDNVVIICSDESMPASRDYDSRLHTTLAPFVSYTSPDSSLRQRNDRGRNKSHRSIAETTTTEVSKKAYPKSTAMPMPYSFNWNLSSFSEMSISVSAECKLPLFCPYKFVRNCITNDIIGHIPDTVQSLRIKSTKRRSVETSNMRRQSFKKVFDLRTWGYNWDLQHQGLNASGRGATLFWTQEAIATLHSVVNLLKVELGIDRVRLLDVPCGDMAWMSRFLRTRDDIDYTGVDIVPDLIQHHQRIFSRYGWHFYEWDIVRDGLEFANMKFDLIICRTLLQHLYTADALRTLAHFSAAPATYGQRVFLLMTSFSRQSNNEELKIADDNPGRFRRLNLELPPISLVPPLCMVRDGPPDTFEGWDHFLGLWELPLRKVSRCWPSAAFTLHNSGQTVYSCVDWSIKAS